SSSISRPSRHRTTRMDPPGCRRHRLAGHAADCSGASLPADEAPREALRPALVGVQRGWLDVAQALAQVGTHVQIGMIATAGRRDLEEATAIELSQPAAVIIVIARAQGGVELRGEAAEPPSNLGGPVVGPVVELDEEGVVGAGIRR